MRYIEKKQEQPTCITDFVEKVKEARERDPEVEHVHLLSYDNFTNTRELKNLLLKEQGELCAYTGVGLDDRLGKRQPPICIPHIEHLKPQAVCRRELEENGKEYGVDVGDDMDYHNMVAALKVDGKGDPFGAVDDRMELLPIKPTDPKCETRFLFRDDGKIEGKDESAKRTIELLKLNHITLKLWRVGAIKGSLPESLSVEDLRAIVAKMDNLKDDGTLNEFCFVIKSIASQKIHERNKGE